MIGFFHALNLIWRSWALLVIVFHLTKSNSYLRYLRNEVLFNQPVFIGIYIQGCSGWVVCALYGIDPSCKLKSIVGGYPLKNKWAMPDITSSIFTKTLIGLNLPGCTKTLFFHLITFATGVVPHLYSHSWSHSLYLIQTKKWSHRRNTLCWLFYCIAAVMWAIRTLNCFIPCTRRMRQYGRQKKRLTFCATIFSQIIMWGSYKIKSVEYYMQIVPQ